MNRRAAWAVAAIVGALVMVGAVVWIWQTSSIRAPEGSSPAETALSTPSQDPRQAAQVQLEELLEDCTADPALAGTMPEGCGIRIPWGTEFAAVEEVRFRIERMPVLTLTDAGFVADGGVLVATVTGTGQDGAPRTETYRTESWSLRGDATVSEDRIEIEIW
ncbi:hypothetical protein [uncultured Microbacterium sp.]|uniref:hypothetical protein n=1 Tax=uncultured Microbacterium sp. TaxID=191216 RepID=UPI0028D161A7|nr:hypothetical protein [uncultured Microbacterium sp.]